ncbi:uncharacterized protein LOC126767429, partial [Bactrocera neohumeralis]|uniref:uncharacterized protein LOC126767429 n=1 Tax=Bactrocera neohumeralis TaxID=98809 RepID=UPI00216551DA
MAWQRLLSSQEILSTLEEEEDLQDATQIDAVYIPPTVDNLTDEEGLDDDALGDFDNIVSTDIAGTYEIHTDLPLEPENTQGELGPSTSKKPRLSKKSPKCVPDWKKEHPTYMNCPTSDETVMTQNIEERVGGKTPFEVFSLFFSDEIWEQIENIHLCDNADLDKNDKFAKLRPIFDVMNQKNMQFGIFSHNLSIDEEMVPYFGRHSCKMFIKGKP